MSLAGEFREQSYQNGKPGQLAIARRDNVSASDVFRLFLKAV
jgi:hypothetical protein